jgi:PhzF family phenazine biosynthesis protein
MSTLPAHDSVRLLQLDVFTDRAGGGNPLGVVFDAQRWDADDMQRFAVWTNLVETTFVLPATEAGADYRLRIFTPTREIPFAGHPTIGSAHAALEAGLVVATDGRLVQECDAGLLPIRVDGVGVKRCLSVEAPGARVLRRDAALDEPALRAALGGIALGTLPPAFVEGGRRWWMAELADEATLRAWQPDHDAIRRLAQATESLGLCVFARAQSPDYQLVVRAFPAGVGIVEDPASGAANGLIAAYIGTSEPDGALARGYRVSQGREIGHDAQLLIRIEGSSVWVGGRTQTVVAGTVSWPLG